MCDLYIKYCEQLRATTEDTHRTAQQVCAWLDVYFSSACAQKFSQSDSKQVFWP